MVSFCRNNVIAILKYKWIPFYDWHNIPKQGGATMAISDQGLLKINQFVYKPSF